MTDPKTDDGAALTKTVREPAIPSPLDLVYSMAEPEREFMLDQCVHGLKPDASPRLKEITLGIFLHRCVKLNLDPFSDSITCIVRYSKGGKAQPAFQTTYLGYRAIAERSGDLLGVEYEYDRDPKPGEKDPPVWCEAKIGRYGATRSDGTRVPVEYRTRCYFTEWTTGTDFWKKRPWDMLRIRTLCRGLKEAFAGEIGDLGIGAGGIEDAVGDERPMLVDSRLGEARGRPRSRVDSADQERKTVPSGRPNFRRGATPEESGADARSL